MKSVQLAAETSTEYSRPLASDKTVSLDSEKREPYHATAVFPDTFSKSVTFFSKMECWSRQHAGKCPCTRCACLRHAKKPNRWGQVQTNYCLKSLEGTVSRGDLQVLHLSRLCFLERKKMCLLDWIRIRPLCIGGLFVSSFKEGSVCWNLTLLLCHSPVDLTAASFLSLLISNFCWFPFVNTKAEKLQI